MADVGSKAIGRITELLRLFVATVTFFECRANP